MPTGKIKFNYRLQRCISETETDKIVDKNSKIQRYFNVKNNNARSRNKDQLIYARKRKETYLKLELSCAGSLILARYSYKNLGRISLSAQSYS